MGADSLRVRRRQTLERKVEPLLVNVSGDRFPRAKSGEAQTPESRNDGLEASSSFFLFEFGLVCGGVRRLPVGGPITELSDLRDGSGLFLLSRSHIPLHTLCAIAVCSWTYQCHM